MAMISVVIPVYNRIRALKMALDSVLAQTYKEIEIIIVDDGSDEENVEYGMLNVGVKLIKQKHAGAPAARNRGLAEAKGEYVIFWDSDVIARPGMLERLKKQLDLHPEASFAYCSHMSYVIGHMSKKISACDFNITRLKKNNYIHSTTLIRRSDAIGWDESIKRFQDWDLWLTMAEQGKNGVWVDEYLFTVLGGGTISKWLPSFAYKAPFKWLPFVSKLVREYNKAKEIILNKHKLSTISS